MSSMENMNTENDKYKSILHIKRPEPSTHHPRMPVSARAAQFAPFAALTGYEDEIEEETRETEEKREPAEDIREETEKALKLIYSGKLDGIRMRVTYFVPDPLKRGGEYRTDTFSHASVDINKRLLCIEKGKKISFDDIFQIFYADGSEFI